MNFFFFENCAFLRNNVKKYRKAGQATDYNMAHVHSMLDNEGYKHTLRICNTYSFSTATVVAQTRFKLTLDLPYIACLVVISKSASLRCCRPLQVLPRNYLRAFTNPVKNATSSLRRIWV